jgi:hypothetical protein
MYISNQVSKRNNGSAAKLIGKCYLASIFIEDNESSWSFEEKTRVLENLSLAIYFIKDEARKYNIELELKRGQYGLSGDVKYNGIISTEMFADHSWTEDVIKLLGHTSGNSTVDFIRREYNVEQVVFIIHVNKAGTSYNLSYSNGISPAWHAERAVLFHSYSNGNLTAAATYVHEILHCFGAGELYFPFDLTEERKQIAGIHFPDDIMYRVDYEITRLNIGSYTAYRIGWSDDLDCKFEVFEDYEDEEI